MSGALLIAVHEALNNIIHFSLGMEQMLASLLPELVKQGLCVAKAISSTNDELSQYNMAGLFSSMQVILDKLGPGCQVMSPELTASMMQCCCALLEFESALVYESAVLRTRLTGSGGTAIPSLWTARTRSTRCWATGRTGVRLR